jgi:hypothetical protein
MSPDDDDDDDDICKECDSVLNDNGRCTQCEPECIECNVIQEYSDDVDENGICTQCNEIEEID